MAEWCKHCRAPHSAASCYTMGCRRRACRAARMARHADYQQTRVQMGHYRPEVDAAPTRARVALLLERGRTQSWVARNVGRTQPWVSGLMAGRYTTVRPETAEAVRELARRVAAGEVAPGVLA